MSVFQLQQSLDNNVWAMTPDSFISFKHTIDTYKNDLSAYTSDTITDNDDAPDTFGRVLINVNGTLVRGSGLPECVCDMLGITDLDYLDEDLTEARDNPDCEAVVILFNSPGGTVHAHSTALLIAEIAQNKDVIGYANAMCCSATYELAAMCSEFYVSDTAWCGFVGTIYTRADYTKANAQDGVGYTFITSSPKKLYLNPNTSMTEEEKAWIEESVMYYYGIFKEDVLSNRQIADEYLDASILIGQQAVDANLADGVVNNLDELAKQMSTISE